MFRVDLIKCVAQSKREARNVYLNVFELNCQEASATSEAQSIKSLISKTETRSIGLRFLIEYLYQYPNNILEDKAKHVLTLLIRACNLTEIRLYGELILEALALLIVQIQAAPEIAKWFGATYISKLYGSLCFLETNDTSTCCTISALKAVKQCLKYYPGHSKSGKLLVIRYLLTLVDSCYPEVVYQSGNCWLLLQQVRSNFSNIGCSNDMTQWQDFHIGLLSSLNGILIEAFPNYTSDKNTSLRYKLDYFDVVLQGDPIERAAQVSTRFCNLIEFLKIALSHPYPSTKLIRPKKILDLILRGLEVTYENCTRIQHINSMCFENILSIMHAKLFELLEVLINVCHTHLRMHYRLISGILLESLKKTKSSTQEKFPNQLVNLRIHVYKVTTLWLTTFVEGSGCDLIAENLVKIILKDVVVCRTDIYLTSMPQSKNGPRSKCMKSERTMPQASFRSGFINTKQKRALCKHALLCLQKVLYSVGHLLKPPLLKVILETLLEISVQIYEKHKRIESPYNDWASRLELYKSIFTFMLIRNIPCSPPLDIILYILEESYKKDPSEFIRNSCKSMIASVEKQLHPQKETVIFEEDAQNAMHKLNLILVDHNLRNTQQKKDQHDVFEIKNDKCLSPIYNSDEKISSIKLVKQRAPHETQQNIKQSSEEINVENIISLVSPKLIDHKIGNKLEFHMKLFTGDGTEQKDKSDFISHNVNLTKCDDDDYIAELKAAFVDELK